MSDIENDYLKKAIGHFDFAYSDVESNAEKHLAEELKKLSARYKESGLWEQASFALNIALLVEAKF